MRGASHTLTVRSKTSPTVNTEGQISYTNNDVSVRGRIMIRNADPQEMEDRGQRSSLPEAIAWLPVGTTVSVGTEIVASGMDSFLNGTWTVQGVQHTPMHYRCFLSGSRAV